MHVQLIYGAVRKSCRNNDHKSEEVTCILASIRGFFYVGACAETAEVSFVDDTRRRRREEEEARSVYLDSGLRQESPSENFLATASFHTLGTNRTPDHSLKTIPLTSFSIKK